MYKVKANWLLDKVSPWSSENSQSDVLEGFSISKLKDCFAQIQVVLAAVPKPRLKGQTFSSSVVFIAHNMGG